MNKILKRNTDDVAARSDFYRNAFNSTRKFSYNTVKALAINEDQLKNILPVQVSNDILMEPITDSSIKAYATVSNKSGLEIPKLSIQLNGADYIDDDGTLQELNITGDSIQFKRYRQFIGIAITDTIYHALDDKFVSSVEQGLKTAVEAIELNNMFSLQPKYEHMSFYTCGIKEIQGNDIYETIKAAIKDLPNPIKRNAKIVINSDDYIALVELLASKGISNIPFKQEIVIEEKCVNPVVGDLSYLHINYDNKVNYDVQKSIKDGLYYFTLDFYGDIQIKLRSAFRIVSVNK
ncbi:hypothetical protein [Clostridium tyrobutyricum]|uniref:hypothetical protein n=1 Tax=Clostridium tyrobutyricum TaxID=1519 RepID=UPI001C38D11D|nr:hypothetical protein [Clostridium tyrobutyricum]MBV4417055.1 hypothetical protein [Clostridium tyrobutyricum]